MSRTAIPAPVTAAGLATLAVLCGSPAAMAQSIELGGNSTAYPSDALDNLGHAYTTTADWPQPYAADVLIISWDGGGQNMPDYTAYLDDGYDILLIGGSNLQDYSDAILPFFSHQFLNTWHQSDACQADWTTTNAHDTTQFLPASHEFQVQTNSYHMLHFDDVQPPNTVLLGSSCEGNPDNVAAVRTYSNHGVFMYMALDVGNYGAPPALGNFLEPLIEGFLASLCEPVGPDTDGDGTADNCDRCPNDFLDDSDGDGVCDSDDICPGFDDEADGDDDGVPNDCDECPFDNPDDTDGDGVCDTDDICKGDDTVDTDGDAIPDDCDACPADATNDTDGDGVCDSEDICPGYADGTDLDGDGQPDGCDPCPADNPDDNDGDGECNSVDPTPDGPEDPKGGGGADSGCACSTAPGASGTWMPLMLGVLAFARRR